MAANIGTATVQMKLLAQVADNEPIEIGVLEVDAPFTVVG